MNVLEIKRDPNGYTCFIPEIKTTLTGKNIVELLRKTADVIEEVNVRSTGKE